MKNLLSGEYFPFGTQYYRAPSPHREDWETDLKKMSEYGFNIVKFWVQWRWNNPEEDKYYFDDIDELMNLAEKYNLRVMLNTIFDVAPAWIYKNVPDASMITLGGKKIGPQSQPHRQIGGLGWCFNNDVVADKMFEFLRATVERYKDHPALEIWNVGSEPELTSSMAEMRAFADDAAKIDDMLCYCENCSSKFKEWLKKRYKNIEKLNESWNRNYSSFEEAELPKTRNTFNDVIDWRMFFVDTIGKNVKRRFEEAAEIDNGKHPLMCHHVFIQGFPITSTANDPWNVAQNGDLHGFTQMDDSMMIDVLRSSAQGKPVMSAEMLLLPGYTLDLPKFADVNLIKKNIFSGIAGNLKGFIFWQYRPEILGREAPTWGLTTLDGKETSWLKSFVEVGKKIQENAGLFLEAKPQEAKIAILYNPENQVFAWASTGNEKSATHSLLGYHRALYRNNFIVDFIHPKDFEKDSFKKYKVIVVPFPYVLSGNVCSKLKSWIEEGGFLISESYFGGWNIDCGHHSKIVPGHGFDEVFGVKQLNAEPIEIKNLSKIELHSQDIFSRAGEVNSNGISAETFFVQDSSIHKTSNNSEFSLNRNFGRAEAGNKFSGTIIREFLEINNAEVIAEFSNGEPAATISSFGKGKALYFASFVGLEYIQKNNNVFSNLLAGLIEEQTDVKSNYTILEDVRVDCLSTAESQIVILQNLSFETKETLIRIPSGTNFLKEIFSGEEVQLNINKENSEGIFQLNPKEVKVYMGSVNG